MKLTGKCKEDFEKWYFYNKTYENFHVVNTIEFNDLTESMQYGVYVDFFDHVDINIMIGNFGYDIREKDNRYIRKTGKTRQEARGKAILKANEIFNKESKEID